MTDKERILTTIIQYDFTHSAAFDENSIRWQHVGKETVLNKGDVLKGCTGHTSVVTVCLFLEMRSEHHLLVQEIGSNKTCEYSNEMFMVLKNFPKDKLLWGDQYTFSQKVKKILRTDFYWLAYGGVEFTNKEATINVRRKFSDEKHPVAIPVVKTLARITLKQIKEAINTLKL